MGGFLLVVVVTLSLGTHWGVTAQCTGITVEGFCSELPIVSVQCYSNQPLETAYPREWAICNISVFENGNPNYLTDVPTTQSAVRLRYRGGQFVKPSFSMDTWEVDSEDTIINGPYTNFGGDARDISLVGMPADHKWVLHAMWEDKTLVRNYALNSIGRQMGAWNPRSVFVDTFLTFGTNATQYMGVYALTEKISRSPFRLDLPRLHPSSWSEPSISGGYIVERDTVNPGTSMVTTTSGINISFSYPSDPPIFQANYLLQWMNRLEAYLSSSGNDSDVAVLASFIELDTFVDYFILVELCYDPTSYLLDTYFYKNISSPLAFGPAWSASGGFGNTAGFSATSGWQFQSTSAVWWIRHMMNNTDVGTMVLNRWTFLRSDVLSSYNIIATIQDAVNTLRFAEVRNFKRWDILNTVVGNEPITAVGTYSQIVSILYEWTLGRLTWLDENMDCVSPGMCIPQVDPPSPYIELRREFEIFYFSPIGAGATLLLFAAIISTLYYLRKWRNYVIAKSAEFHAAKDAEANQGLLGAAAPSGSGGAPSPPTSSTPAGPSSSSLSPPPPSSSSSSPSTSTSTTTTTTTTTTAAAAAAAAAGGGGGGSGGPASTSASSAAGAGTTVGGGREGGGSGSRAASAAALPGAASVVASEGGGGGSSGANTSPPGGGATGASGSGSGSSGDRSSLPTGPPSRPGSPARTSSHHIVPNSELARATSPGRRSFLAAVGVASPPPDPPLAPGERRPAPQAHPPLDSPLSSPKSTLQAITEVIARPSNSNA